jgi:hypothetical protein
MFLVKTRKKFTMFCSCQNITDKRIRDNFRRRRYFRRPRIRIFSVGLADMKDKGKAWDEIEMEGHLCETIDCMCFGH